MHFTATAALPGLAALAFLPAHAWAQGVGQQSASGIETIVVTGTRASRTAVDAEAARAALRRIPGAVGLVEAEVFADDFAQSIGDALLFTPGVFADTSAQRESRLSIRGSGLNSTFERRGLTVRRDGVPISRASGITEFQEVDPLTIDYIEVFKGANGLAYGAASLGGAVNIVTPTGRTQAERFTLRAEGGSFGTARLGGSVALSEGAWDLHSGTTALHTDGFRDHSQVRSLYNHTNAGYDFGGGVETRFYLTALTDNFELAGSLGLEDALANPRDAARPVTTGPFFPGGPVTVLDPGPLADDWDRNLDVVRLANKTVIPVGGARLSVGGWYAHRDLDHAITRFAGLIGQSEDEVGGFARLEGHGDLFGFGTDWVLGVEAAGSGNDARVFENASGERGAPTRRSDQDARNLLAFAQAEVALTDALTAVIGAQALEAVRESGNVLNAVDGRVEERQVNPRLGLLWDATGDAQVFANVNRGFEPAGITDLTAGGILDFTLLDPQRAWTAEVGTRGTVGIASWDIALYRSWIEGEFVDLAQPGFAGFVSATFNADETVHQGVEAGVDLTVTPPALGAVGAVLTWRQTYTYNDFFFASDPQDLDGAAFAFDGNALAGVPEHVYVTELRLETDRWYATGNLRWVPDGPFADFANTVRVPGYALLGVTAGCDLAEGVRVFASAENLTDEAFISNVATVADLSVQADRIFTPGQGRAVFAGLSLGF